jgi:hypothetical protein
MTHTTESPATFRDEKCLGDAEPRPDLPPPRPLLLVPANGLPPLERPLRDCPGPYDGVLASGGEGLSMTRENRDLKGPEAEGVLSSMARGNLEVSSTALVDTWRLRVGADPILEASDGWSLACMSVRNKGFQLLHRRSTKESMRCE